jgi:hypothetical protein
MNKYELVYSDGGHVGPYNSFTAAVLQAKNRARWYQTFMDIVNRTTGQAYCLTMENEQEFTITKSKRKYRAPFP